MKNCVFTGNTARLVLTVVDLFWTESKKNLAKQLGSGTAFRTDPLKMVHFAVWPLLLLPLAALAFNDVFDEELLIKPLPDGFVYSYFQFTTRWQLAGNDSRE